MKFPSLPLLGAFFFYLSGSAVAGSSFGLIAQSQQYIDIPGLEFTGYGYANPDFQYNGGFDHVSNVFSWSQESHIDFALAGSGMVIDSSIVTLSFELTLADNGRDVVGLSRQLTTCEGHIFFCSNIVSAVFAEEVVPVVGGQVEVLENGDEETSGALQLLFSTREVVDLGATVDGLYLLSSPYPCLDGEFCEMNYTIDDFSPVPLPSGAWLFASSLILLFSKVRGFSRN
jgi:hypothetical protein